MPSQAVPVIDIDSDDPIEIEDNDIETEAFVIDDDTEDDDFELECIGGVSSERNSVPLPLGSLPITIATVTFRGSDFKLRPTMVIERNPDEFFCIAALFIAPSGARYASGHTLLRNRIGGNFLPKKTNEVFIWASVYGHRQDPTLNLCQTTIELPQNVIIRDCVFTNLPFPEKSYREDPAKVGEGLRDIAEEHFHLTCRRIFIEKFEGSSLVEMVWLNLTEDHCRALGGDHFPDLEVREAHIGTARAQARLAPHKLRLRRRLDKDGRVWTTDVLRDLAEPAIRNRVDGACTDTYGDVFTGSGGTASGAAAAGLKLRFLLDHAYDMIMSLRLNFAAPDVDIRHQDVSEFCRCQGPRSVQVDVLHISFPCCAYCYLNHGGSMDQVNIDTGYSVAPILEITKPLIVTFEQVPGIRTRRDGENFHDLVHQLMSCHYSARARVEKLSEHGLCSQRKRLMLFASCPGQSLPRFPEITHGVGAKRFATMADMLTKLNDVDIPRHMQDFTSREGPRYDPNQQMQTITGNGGRSNVHYSGRRGWTLAEYAVLQGYSPHHQFYGTKTSILKQIANSVPPVVAEKFFRHIRKHLRMTDRDFARKDTYIDLT